MIRGRVVELVEGQPLADVGIGRVADKDGLPLLLVGVEAELLLSRGGVAHEHVDGTARVRRADAVQDLVPQARNRIVSVRVSPFLDLGWEGGLGGLGGGVAGRGGRRGGGGRRRGAEAQRPTAAATAVAQLTFDHPLSRKNRLNQV